MRVRAVAVRSGRCRATRPFLGLPDVPAARSHDMPVQPADPTELKRVPQRYGLRVSQPSGRGLSDEVIASFSPMMHGFLASWDTVEELYAASAPAMPKRTWT